MITLDLKPYCQDCPYYTTHVDEIDKNFHSRMTDSMLREKKDFIISCLHKYTCENLVQYLEGRNDNL